MNLFIQLTVLFFAVTNCTAQEPWRKKCVNNFELLFYKSPTKTYTQAKTFCEGLGGYLPKVDNEKMTYVINSTFKIEGEKNSFFIGGNDRKKEGDWKWQDGTDVIMRGETGYQNWKSNQPNNVGNNEDCLLVGRQTYLWVDSSCDDRLFYICQRDGRGRASVKKTKIDETTRECVLTTCDTSATVGWYKDSGKISTDSGNTVYQELKSGSAILYLKHANISDSGTYSCQARISNQKKEINMTYEVAGKPTIHKISNFPCKSNLEVHWKPNKNSVGFPHKIEAKLGSGGLIETKWTDSPTFENQTTTLSSLNSSTKYNVEVTACVRKESCSTSLFNRSKYFRTDGAVPTVMSASVAQNNENQSCVISWGTNEDDKTDQKTELTMNETLISKRDSKINEGKISKQNVTSSEHHNFTPEPNRKYSVSIKIYNCAGASQPLQVSGNCKGKPGAPGSVPVPKNSDGDVISANGTHSITVQRPDETNGLVSCLFVMVAKAGAGDNAIFTLEDLQKANNSLNDSSSEYIAMALPVSSMQETQITVQLGDESVTSCDVNKTEQNNSGRRKRSTDNANLFIGRNGKLDKENAYSVSIVSSTPAEDTIYFKRSTGITLKKAEDKGGGTPVWIFAVIAVVVILIIVVIVVVVVKKRRANEDPKLNQQQLGQDNPVQPEPHVEPREINGGQRDPQLIQPQRPQFAEVLIDRDHGEYVNYIPQRNQPVTETTITTSDLEKVYNSMKMKGNQQFVEQFREILQEAARYGGTKTFASDEALKKKNRYKNILPFDDSRVPLSGTREGYINACFINGHKINRKYIATQGPLPGTVNDFWQMIVEHKCCVIVMLAREIEAGKKKCAKYWPDAGKQQRFGGISVENRQEVNYSAFRRRVFSVMSEKQEQLTVYQYQFLKWPDHGVPQTTSNLFRMHRAVLKSCQELGNDNPIVVHCSAGAGRTGTFIGYDILLDESNSTGSIDAYTCVINMRKQRVEMVQNADQYVLVHKLVLETVLLEDRDLSPDEAKNKLEMIESSREGQAILKREFDDVAKVRPMKDSRSVGNENKKQCRSRNAIPYDYSLVKLTLQADEDKVPFYNASWIESYDESSPMIASQSPNSSNINLFWRMVYDNNVNTIVMLTKAREGNEEQSAIYWPSGIGEQMNMKSITVTLVSDETDGPALKRKLKIERGAISRTVTQLHYTGWNSTSCPEDGRDVIELVNKMQKNIRSTGDGVALIHCSDGIGRTGAFCAAVNLVDRLKCENRVDVFRTVKDLRDGRPNMVGNLEQYKFCYQAIADYLKSFELYANF